MDLESTLYEALALHQKGELSAATEIYERVIIAAPRNADAHHLLGVVHKMQGRVDVAISHIDMAISIDGKQAVFYNNLGTCYLLKTQSVAAELCFRKAVDLQDDYADAWSNVGLICLNAHRFDEAEQALKRVLDAEPDHQNALCNMGEIGYGRGRHADSLVWFEKAAKLYPHSAHAVFGRVRSLNELGRVHEALDILDQASLLDDQTKEVEAMMLKGEMLESLGKMEEACEAMDRGLKIDPGNVALMYSRSRVKKITRQDPFFAHLRQYEGTVEHMVGRHRARLAYTLAKVYEDVGDMAQAARFYAIGANAVLQATEYAEMSDVTVNRTMRTVCTPAYLRDMAAQGHPSEKPIFILGMPRSGTTLVEQIIGSHPDVFAAGELEAAVRAMSNFSLTPDVVLRNDRALEMDAHLTVAQRGQLYLDTIAARPGIGNQKHVTDKMPANYLLLGLIAGMLPDSTIIHCRRSPIDTCLSNYVTYFTDGQLWSYDFSTLGRYFRRYWELMEHWRAALPGRFLDMRYETVVQDTEAQARRLLEWCDLPWDDRCLRFYETQRAVNTASVQQVRQPIYQSSMGRWKKWGSTIDPLLAEIGDLEEAYWAEIGVGVDVAPQAQTAIII